MTKYLLVAIALAGCLQKHDGVQSLGKTDCYTCHAADYEGTPAAAAADPAVPDHLAQSSVYTKQCADCHVTTTWFSHPDKLFPIQKGAHAMAQCTQCHANPDDNTGDAHGTNTQCVSCHPAGENLVGGGTMTTGHSDQTAFSYTAPPTGYTPQNFCLSCHPTGVEAPHPDASFPQNHGSASTCTSCHDRTKGSDAAGQNADCRRCHTGDLRTIGDHPGDVNTIPSPSGCLRCHLGGRGGGN